MIAIAPPRVTLAQGVDAQMLLHPPSDSWPGYHGDYSGRRHSPLTQITPQNVKNLGLSWAFQTGQRAPIKSSPLLVDGILYFTVPDHIWAVDARSGHQIWHYTYPPNNGNHIGNRGVAMYKGYLFFLSPDAHHHLQTLTSKVCQNWAATGRFDLSVLLGEEPPSATSLRHARPVGPVELTFRAPTGHELLHVDATTRQRLSLPAEMLEGRHVVQLACGAPGVDDSCRC